MTAGVLDPPCERVVLEIQLSRIGVEVNFVFRQSDDRHVSFNGRSGNVHMEKSR